MFGDILVTAVGAKGSADAGIPTAMGPSKPRSHRWSSLGWPSVASVEVFGGFDVGLIFSKLKKSKNIENIEKSEKCLKSMA